MERDSLSKEQKTWRESGKANCSWKGGESHLEEASRKSWNCGMVWDGGDFKSQLIPTLTLPLIQVEPGLGHFQASVPG